MELLLFWGLFAAFAVVEAFLPRRGLNVGRRARWPANVVLLIMSFALAILLPVSFIQASLWAAESGLGVLNLVALPDPLVIVISVLCMGTISFLSHFLQHKVPILWRVHRVHHLDTEFDVTTNGRFHPFEYLVMLTVGLPVVVALGLPPLVVGWYGFVEGLVTLFSHTNIRWPRVMNRALRFVVVTPEYHRVHHLASQVEGNRNFASVLPVLDLMFGTYHAPEERHEHMALGLEEVRDARVTRLGWLLSSPFRGTSFDRADPAALGRDRGGPAAAGGPVVGRP